jgi:hypothetical protein
MQTTIRFDVDDVAGNLRLVRRYWQHGIDQFNPQHHTLDNGNVWRLPDLGKWLLGFPVDFPAAIVK